MTWNGANGWEMDKVSTPPSPWIRTTAQASPRGGLASITTTGSGFASDLRHYIGNAQPTANQYCAYSCDFRIDRSDLMCPLAAFSANSKEYSLYYNSATGFLTIYRYDGGATYNEVEVGTVGTFTISADTWYRLWWLIYAASGTGTITVEARVALASSDPQGQTAIDANFSIANTSAIITFALGRTHGAGIIGQQLWMDNEGRDDNIQYGAERYVACVKGTVTADGTVENDFGVTNIAPDTARWEAVDESPPNGTGTSLVGADYVYITSTAAVQQEFVITSATRPTGYDQPVSWKWAIWHANNNGGKWGTGGARNRINSVLTENTSQYADPGTTWVPTIGLTNLFPEGSSMAAMTTVEAGISKQANALEAALWVISGLNGEFAYCRQTRRRMGQVI